MAGGVAGDDIDTLVREAEARLQASKLGRAASLGNLPLYLLVGEPGSAKTSIVLHSGLEPELLAGQTVQDNVPVPTRTVNLWYTRQSIFAEAGGPMLQNQPLWAGLVKRLAPRRLHSVFGRGTPAPRAAVVCVDCESFMKAGAAEAISATAERIRDAAARSLAIVGHQHAGLRGFHPRRSPAILSGLRPQPDLRRSLGGFRRDVAHGDVFERRVC